MDRGAWQATVHGVTFIPRTIFCILRISNWFFWLVSIYFTAIIFSLGKIVYNYLRILNIFKVKLSILLFIFCHVFNSSVFCFDFKLDVQFSNSENLICMFTLNGKCFHCFTFLVCGLTEKAMAPHSSAMVTHSSTLAWKIPWTEETGGLQSMGLLGVKHD